LTILSFLDPKPDVRLALVPCIIGSKQQQTDLTTMTVTTNSHDDDDDEDISSPTERCAFVLHVTVAIFAVVYTAWVLLAMFGGATSGGSNMPPPPPSWLTHTLPTVAVGLFFAAPILYAVQNMTIVAPAHSIASLHDSVTAKQNRRPNVTQPAPNNDTSNNAARPGLPEIVDLDVAEINDLCWKAMQTSSW
jgi:hypothetical protein